MGTGSRCQHGDAWAELPRLSGDSRGQVDRGLRAGTWVEKALRSRPGDRKARPAHWYGRGCPCGALQREMGREVGRASAWDVKLGHGLDRGDTRVH